MRFRTCVCACWLTIRLVDPSGPAAATDRLDRFRQLAASHLAALELSGADSSAEVFREIYALLDDEILESLAAGSVFASEGFLQERLDAFTNAWGGSAFRVLNLPEGNLTLGSFQLSARAGGNSVRVYRRLGNRAERLAAIHRAGIPHLFLMPPARSGQAQFLVLWVGPLSLRGSPLLQMELWRQQDDRVRVAWTTSALFGPEFDALSYTVRGQELVVRYAARYPGWKPGCEGQTEQEDHYRYVPTSETFLLVRRQVDNGWHRELHATVERLLVALWEGDERTLSALGLPSQLARRLPERLEPEPVCDMWDGPSPQVVTVSATAPGDPQPWGLRFRRTPQGWGFGGAERLPGQVGTPVLQWGLR
jgi:hypothetical protein